MTSRCGVPFGSHESQEGSPQAAAEIAATVPLLFTYPATLRDQLLPLAAETMVSGGELPAASAVLAAAQECARPGSGARHAARRHKAMPPGRWRSTTAGAIARISLTMHAPRYARWNCGSPAARSTPNRQPAIWIGCSMPGAAISRAAHCASGWPN